MVGFPRWEPNACRRPPDFQSQNVNTLSDTHGCVHSPLIFQRYGEVGRVGDNHGGFWYCGDHTTAHPDLPHLLHLSFDGRITFRLFEFFF